AGRRLADPAGLSVAVRRRRRPKRPRDPAAGRARPRQLGRPLARRQGRRRRHRGRLRGRRPGCLFRRLRPARARAPATLTRRIRPVPSPLVLAVLALALLGSACQRAMSVDEAKQVTARFAGRAFVPPPRTINDIMTILEQGKRNYPDAVAKVHARGDVCPTASSVVYTLAP